MGGASSGRGGVADATLNVIPFIDLLACCICFLLVSAAWVSLARLPVDQALPRSGDKPVVRPTLRVAITAKGYQVSLGPVEGHPELATPRMVPAIGHFELCRGTGTAANCDGKLEKFRRYDRAGLQAAVKGMLATSGLPASSTSVMVGSADALPYLHLIGTLDALLATCTDPAGANCLRSPSVADLGLLRAAGFTALD